VIADRARALGIGGIMGGTPSGCTPATVNVFLEAALFDPLRTAATGRKLQIQSDARYRFERGVDPVFVPDGVEIASALILELCGGEASKTVVAGKIPEQRRSFTLRKSRVKSLGGVDVAWPEQKRILAALGFGVTEGTGGLACAVPSWRPDIGGEADLVEEVCRIVGLDKVPAAPMPRPHAVARPVLNSLQRRTLLARRRLAGRGLDEAVTWSFLSAAHAELFGGGRPELKLVNPISSELTDMRPSLLPNLIAAAGRNLARGLDDVALFEIGQAYAGDRPEDESLRAAGIRQGDDHERHWSARPRPVDLFDAKADALAVLAAAGAPASGLQVAAEAPAWFHPGRSGSIRLGPKTVLAVFGEVHPGVLRAMDVKGPLVAFEAMLDAIPEARGRLSARPALDASDLMPVSRDFAFVVDAGLEADRIVRAARSADRNLIAAVNVFDVFSGGAVDAGRKSVAIEVVLQPRDRTLTEAEIDEIGKRIVAEVAKATGAVLRT
jgi:phenylalanyl-tRNA synthetase beta chain